MNIKLSDVIFTSKVIFYLLRIFFLIKNILKGQLNFDENKSYIHKGFNFEIFLTCIYNIRRRIYIYIFFYFIFKICILCIHLYIG